MSKIEVDAVEPQSGTTLTLGASGDTVTLAAGALQSGFGRSGSVNWDTTAKTANFTAVNGVGYFANTSGGAFTMSLPAGSAGAIVSVADYTNSFQTNALTIAPNGSEKINGGAGVIILNTEGQSLTLVYVDGTEGWKSVQDSTTSPVGNNFVLATGGTITTSGDYKIHTFTGPGTFTVTSAGNPLGSTVVDYMVVAGGGASTNTGAGADGTGGGGAGGFRESVPSPAAWTASPLANPGGSLPVSVQGYPITVGAGGATGPMAPYPNASFRGSSSIALGITSTGGGGAAGFCTAVTNGMPGGSAGGGRGISSTGGNGNTPPVAPPQGQPGGAGGGTDTGGGGGGATVSGGSATPTLTGGAGGNGATTSISGSPTTYAGGGGGSSGNTCNFNAAGGTGGGGIGGSVSGPNAAGVAGGINTGGGGGGAGAFTPCTSPTPLPGNAGGSGIVIIRYKYQ
jgi:hypothetical protein